MSIYYKYFIKYNKLLKKCLVWEYWQWPVKKPFFFFSNLICLLIEGWSLSYFIPTLTSLSIVHAQISPGSFPRTHLTFSPPCPNLPRAAPALRDSILQTVPPLRTKNNKTQKKRERERKKFLKKKVNTYKYHAPCAL